MLPRFVSQGTYGCIYRPGLQCNGKPYNKENFITKVQRNLTVSLQEEKISALVVKIPHFSKYFAPILKPPCQVELASIQEGEIEKCDFIKKKTDTKWKINTLRYVGKQTLIDHVLHIYLKQNKNFLFKFLETQLHLLNGFSKLQKAGVIHNDVKDNNIICDSNGTPIIIDFGLSVVLTTATQENSRQLFFNYDPDYYPWVIDFQISAFGSTRLPSTVDRWFESPVTSEQINTVITDIVNLNVGLQSFFTETERQQYGWTMRTFFTKYVGTKWGTMINELMTFSKSWDNYSLAMTYLCILYDLKISETESSIPKIAEYIKVIKQIILAAPDKRPTCIETLVTLKNMFRKVPIQQKQQLQQYVNKMSRNRQEVLNMRTNVLNSRLRLLKMKQRQKV